MSAEETTACNTDVVLTAFRSTLNHLRQVLLTHHDPSTQKAALSIVTELQYLLQLLLPSTASSIPSELSLPSSCATDVPQCEAEATATFQTRTLYRSVRANEHRAPVADCTPSIRNTSLLRLNTSQESLCSMSSLPSMSSIKFVNTFSPVRNRNLCILSPGCVPSRANTPRVYGYSGYQVDDACRHGALNDGYAPFPNLTCTDYVGYIGYEQRWEDCGGRDVGVGIAKTEERTAVQSECSATSQEEISLIRLRNSMYEIGSDGRIRRQMQCLEPL